MNGSITEILYRIKTNIAAVENGDIRTPIIEEIESDFIGFLELTKLFLISERDSYYGYFLMKIRGKAYIDKGYGNGIQRPLRKTHGTQSR